MGLKVFGSFLSLSARWVKQSNKSKYAFWSKSHRIIGWGERLTAQQAREEENAARAPLTPSLSITPWGRCSWGGVTNDGPTIVNSISICVCDNCKGYRRPLCQRLEASGAEKVQMSLQWLNRRAPKRCSLSNVFRDYEKWKAFKEHLTTQVGGNECTAKSEKHLKNI